MSHRRLVSGAALILLGIGLFRGTVQSVLSHAGAGRAAHLFATTIALTMFWLPVVLLVDASWRRPGSSRARTAFQLAVGAAVLFVEPAWVRLVRTGLEVRPGGFATALLWRIDTNLLFYVCVVGATWAIEQRRRQAAAELSAARLERALADEQLHVLTLQLHPHFLFNTLNLISQLAYESVAEAQRTLANLRGLLVQSLAHAGRREVSLRDELSLLTAYLQIQQGRFREQLTVTVDAAPAALPAVVPHLLLQPLVENSIVHAIGPRAAGGHIRVTARRDGDRLRIRIADDGPGVVLPVRDGLGLGNTRLRLAQLFGDDHRLDVARDGDAGTVVTVDVPFRVALATSTARDSTDADGLAATSADPVPPAHGRLVATLQVVCVWALMAGVWTELESLVGPNAGNKFVWTTSALSSGINALLWVLLTPAVVWFARRVNLSRRPTRGAFAAHVVASAVVALSHVVAWLAVLAVVLPSEYPKHLNQSFDWLLWDIVAYVGVVAFATVVSIAARHRDVKLAIAASRARLSQAAITSMRLRLQPGILLGGLDAIASAIASDAEQSELAITRMGDLLRGLLRSADREQLSVAEELALLHAYVDVLSAGSADGPVTLESDVPWPRAAASVVPALATVSLAAVITGSISAVSVATDADALIVRVLSATGRIDQGRFTDLDVRLRAIGGSGHRMDVHAESTGMVLELRVPVDAASTQPADAPDELMIA